MVKRIGCAISGIVLCLFATAEAESVDEIFLAQRQNFARLKSISMVYAEDWDSSEVMKTSKWPITRAPAHLVFGFKKEGEKFRVDHALEGTKVTAEQEKSLISSVLAFDLNKYQRYEKSSLYLRVQSDEINPLSETNCPLIMAYRPLLDMVRRLDTSYSEIQDAQVWEVMKQHVQIGAGATVDGHDCVRTDFTYPAKPYTGYVYWARDLGYYPLRLQLVNRDGKKLIETVVKDVARRETPEGSVFIPMVLEETQWPETADHKLFTIKFTVDPNSLSVNEDIPDDVFTIPLHMVRTYEDMDDPKAYFSTEDVVDKSMESINSPGPRPGDPQHAAAQPSPDVNTSSTDQSPSESRKAVIARAPSGKWIYPVGGIVLLGVLALLYGRHRRAIGK